MPATDLTLASTLADVVDTSPGTARLLESLGLDYCCGGKRSLADACADAGVDPQAVLDAATEQDSAPAAWSAMTPAELVDHIETTHHAYLHAELPRLRALADKVAKAHGARHPELADVVALVDSIQADLEPHLLKEERVLFPMIRELATASTAPVFHCGSIRNPVGMMTMEHDRAGVLLAELRRATGDYEVPADACASYRMLYAGLRELEADTHLHVHKENNALFPAVVELEQGLVDRS
jgi:regulator of cell morphogenesis and NO signaling